MEVETQLEVFHDSMKGEIRAALSYTKEEEKTSRHEI